MCTIRQGLSTIVSLTANNPGNTRWASLELTQQAEARDNPSAAMPHKPGYDRGMQSRAWAGSPAEAYGFAKSSLLIYKFLHIVILLRYCLAPAQQRLRLGLVFRPAGRLEPGRELPLSITALLVPVKIYTKFL